jgi:hypothetical protein
VLLLWRSLRELLLLLVLRRPLGKLLCRRALGELLLLLVLMVLVLRAPLGGVPRPPATHCLLRGSPQASVGARWAMRAVVGTRSHVLLMLQPRRLPRRPCWALHARLLQRCSNQLLLVLLPARLLLSRGFRHRK